jgi:hypothetical protein
VAAFVAAQLAAVIVSYAVFGWLFRIPASATIR